MLFGDGRDEITRRRQVDVADVDDPRMVEATRARLVQLLFQLLVDAAHVIPDGMPDRHGNVQRLGEPSTSRSEERRGTTFRVTLPIAEAGTAAVGGIRMEPSASPRRARVLVVDDEPMLLRTTTRILATEFDVVAVSSGAEAIAAIEADATFDVLLCDLLMPKMSGIVLYETVRARWPRLAERTVFLSGGVFTSEAQRFLENAGRSRLDKPFSVDELLRLVREVCGAASR